MLTNIWEATILNEQICTNVHENSHQAYPQPRAFSLTTGSAQSLARSVLSALFRSLFTPFVFSSAQMASVCASLVAPVASAKVATPAKQTSFNGLARMPFNKVQKNTFAQRTVSNGIKTRQMLVWQPTNNK